MPTYHVNSSIGTFHLSGDLGPQCADCYDLGAYLCDYPIGGGLTCDRSICEQHGTIVGDDLHYCFTHAREYQDNNPGKLPYVLNRYRLKTLPSMAHTAMSFLKSEFDKRDPGNRDHHLKRFLLNSALPLGVDAARAAHGEVAEHCLAGGLRWCINNGLVQICWRKPPGQSPLPMFALTSSGLRVMEGEEVDAIDTK